MSLLAAIQDQANATALFLDSIALVFHAHILRRLWRRAGGGSFARAGLAPWQLRRVDAFIDARFHGDPSVSDLAGECRLSESYFAHAFGQTTGMSPYRWMMKRRVERAKELLFGAISRLPKSRSLAASSTKVT